MATIAPALCGGFPDHTARASVAGHLWGSGAVLGTTDRKCRPAGERRNSSVAAQRFLDAAGARLHAVDDRAVRMDLLRSLSAQIPAEFEPRRHCFLFARHPHDGGAGAASTSQA